MDKFLFRAKRKDNGEWVQGIPHYGLAANLSVIVSIIPVADFRGIKTHCFYDRVEVDENTITQFTGRCASNGKKIFAGDILKISSTSEFAYEEFEIVKFDKERCGFKVYSDSGFTDGELPDAVGKDDEWLVEIVDNEFDTTKKWEWKGL